MFLCRHHAFPVSFIELLLFGKKNLAANFAAFDVTEISKLIKSGITLF